MKGEIAKDIDSYISQQTEKMQPLLEELRTAVKSAVPHADEVISYGMPAFRQNAVLVYFAACKNHIGFYPTNSGIAAFTKEWKDYKTSRGAVQLPLDKPLPLKLIARVTKFRLKEELERAKLKQKKKK